MRHATTYNLLPPVFDLRLLPIAYGIGYVIGLFAAFVKSLVLGTRLRDEAEELPLYVGLFAAALYLIILIRGLLLVS